MSESNSNDDDKKTGDELRKEALEKGFVLDDTGADEPIYPEEKKGDGGDGKSDR